jgi:8-oxo-dGTP pyrophosphatase MutT (NUDIX family)
MQSAPASAPGLPADWLPRLRSCLLPKPEHRPEYWRLGGATAPPTAAMRESIGGAPLHAAVLIPVIRRGQDSSILLTRRASQLRNHAGQISFPGGRLEASDADPVAAALRETSEEIGVESRFVEPLGFLPDHLVLTGFRITPVVALLHPGYELRLDSAEVDEVFEVPLGVIMNRSRYLPNRRQLRGFEVLTYDLPFGDHQIWGATAGMLLTLCNLFEKPVT